jgi:hypothetical protein
MDRIALIVWRCGLFPSVQPEIRQESMENSRVFEDRCGIERQTEE